MSDHFGRCSTLVSCQSLPKAFKLHSGKDKILWYNTIIMRMITQWWYRRATKTQNGHQNTQSPTKRLHVAAYSGRSQWKWLFISFHQVTSLISQNNRCVHFRREDTHTHTMQTHTLWRCSDDPSQGDKQSGGGRAACPRLSANRQGGDKTAGTDLKRSLS